MPNALQRQLAQDATQILAQIGHVVTWNGEDYDCVLTEPDVEVDLQEGGFMPDGDFTVKFLRCDFNGGDGPFPGHNDRVTYDGNVYKVTAATNKKDSPYIKVSIAK